MLHQKSDAVAAAAAIGKAHNIEFVGSVDKDRNLRTPSIGQKPEERDALLSAVVISHSKIEQGDVPYAASAQRLLQVGRYRFVIGHAVPEGGGAAEDEDPAPGRRTFQRLLFGDVPISGRRNVDVGPA